MSIHRGLEESDVKSGVKTHISTLTKQGKFAPCYFICQVTKKGVGEEIVNSNLDKGRLPRP